ncbi:MAG: ATP-grasp domain-containing protein [Methanoregula sp.]|jgi:predicted ATP-grasp superfamily ATP-dependent carboligase|uniref:carboxylate--amine ligase n=1 Tax=Methanoregula sp. TaxID=2052170 RepID=UPI003D104FEC
MTGVLITGANSIKALIAIRSLGKKGIPVYTADSINRALGSFSKYSKRFYTCPQPATDLSIFISVLQSTLKKNRCEVLIPVHSADTYVIAKYKSRFEPFAKVPLHDYTILANVNNKGYLMKVADELGFPIPRTYFVESFNELKTVSETITYPAVIKLRESSSSIGLSYVHSKDELISKFKATTERFRLSSSNYPIIQEYIVGDGYGVSLLFNKGDPRAIFTHKRIREYPITGGPSSFRVSVKQPEMEKIAVDLLKHFNWHGVAMVEFKLTPERKPVIMEVNPRFWGSLNQAILAGVDFPYMLYTMAVEGDVKPVFNYKLGIESRNAFIDTVALLKTMRKTGNVHLLKNLMRVPRNDDILSLDDPLPAISFLGRGIRELFYDKR